MSDDKKFAKRLDEFARQVSLNRLPDETDDAFRTRVIEALNALQELPAPRVFEGIGREGFGHIWTIEGVVGKSFSGEWLDGLSVLEGKSVRVTVEILGDK